MNEIEKLFLEWLSADDENRDAMAAWDNLNSPSQGACYTAYLAKRRQEFAEKIDLAKVATALHGAYVSDHPEKNKTPMLQYE